MNRFVVVTFPDETKAGEGMLALKELHAEGHIALYASAVIVKEPDGTLAVKHAAEEGPLGTAVGALVGTIVGLLGGPIGVIAGFTAGGALGSLRDFFTLGIREDFVQRVADQLTPGKSAVIAEVAEHGMTAIDSRMSAIRGVVNREARVDVEDEVLQRQADALRAELDQARAEYAATSQEARATLDARIEEARGRLAATLNRITSHIERVERETDAKLASLQQQAEQANAEARAKIEQRMAELRADGDRRLAKLHQAWELTKEAVTGG